MIHNANFENKYLDEIGGIVIKRSSVKGVKKRMTGSVSNAAASMSLATLTVLKRLTAESSLVNFSLGGSRKWHSVIFKFNDGLWSNFGHVVNSILVSQPI